MVLVQWEGTPQRKLPRNNSTTLRARSFLKGEGMIQLLLVLLQLKNMSGDITEDNIPQQTPPNRPNKTPSQKRQPPEWM